MCKVTKVLSYMRYIFGIIASTCPVNGCPTPAISTITPGWYVILILIHTKDSFRSKHCAIVVILNTTHYGLVKIAFTTEILLNSKHLSVVTTYSFTTYVFL